MYAYVGGDPVNSTICVGWPSVWSLVTRPARQFGQCLNPVSYVEVQCTSEDGMITSWLRWVPANGMALDQVAQGYEGGMGAMIDAQEQSISLSRMLLAVQRLRLARSVAAAFSSPILIPSLCWTTCIEETSSTAGSHGKTWERTGTLQRRAGIYRAQGRPWDGQRT